MDRKTRRTSSGSSATRKYKTQGDETKLFKTSEIADAKNSGKKSMNKIVGITNCEEPEFALGCYHGTFR